MIPLACENTYIEGKVMNPIAESKPYFPLAEPCHMDALKACASADITPEQLYESLKQDYYAQVSFDVPPETIQEAMKSFFSFLELPDELKMAITGKVAPLHRRGDLGLARRNPADGAYSDQKEFFHYHPQLQADHATLIAKYPAMKAFLDHADNIWHKGADTARMMLSKLENFFPGVYKGIFDQDHTPHLVLRFLRYQWDETQENLAKAHFDAGSCTLAIAESSPGLRIGSCHDDLKAVKHQPNHALFFLAQNFKALANSNDLLPGWHDVVRVDAPTNQASGTAYTRWALVLFIEGHSLTAPSRSETHNIALQPR
jgi:isopenicillin N synthase-like dioxygenase